MSPRALLRLSIVYLLLLAAACAVLRAMTHLDPAHLASEIRIVSVWRNGQRIGRVVIHGDAKDDLAQDCRRCTRIVERVIDSGPLPSFSSLLFALSLAAGRDGIAVQLDSRTLYWTPSDLLAHQASSEGARIGKLELRIGLNDPEALLAELASELHVDVPILRARASLRRFIVRREDEANLWPADAAGPQPSAARLWQSVEGAAEFLAQNQHLDGRFAYELDAVSGAETSADYNWPRHGGATLTLAQVASRTHRSRIAEAAVRAAHTMQRDATLACGGERCIGQGTSVDAGSSALALMAYSELTQSGISLDFRDDVRALSRFLRSLQRPDGEFRHVYDREKQRALDIQLPYYSGEAALALARAYEITHDPADLRAASRGLSHLVQRGLLQNRYMFGTEHWTCQVLEALWKYAPDRAALAFCLDYQRYNRSFQLGAGSEFGNFEGGFAPNPFSAPRVTPTASRNEGAVATMVAARAAHVDVGELRALEAQVRGALRFMLRFQLQPGPRYLMRDARRVQGGLPGSPTDLHVRIDYQQHAVGSMLRYLRWLGAPYPG
jgi:hypothetical protein